MCSHLSTWEAQVNEAWGFDVIHKILFNRLVNEGYEQRAQEMRESRNESRLWYKIHNKTRKYEAVLCTTEKAIEKIYSEEQRIDALTTAITSIATMRCNSTSTQPDDAIIITPVSLIASAFRVALDATPVPAQARNPTTISPTPNQNPNSALHSSPIILQNIHKTMELNIEHWITNC
jgi:hypothetical protein